MRLRFFFNAALMCKRHKERQDLVSFNVKEILNRIKVHCTCLVHLANLSKRWYYAGFKFASSVGSGRVLFNQTVYSHKAFRGFLTSSLAHWYREHSLWKDKQKSKHYNCFPYSITDNVKVKAKLKPEETVKRFAYIM